MIHPCTRTIIVLLAAFACDPAANAAPRLQGDPQAVERVEKMLEQLGGARAWADARTLYLEYRGWRLEPDGPLSELAWRDLHEPRQRIDLDGPAIQLTWVFTPESGWVRRKAGVTMIPADRHAGALADWPFDFYTILRSFAVADTSFRLEFAPPRTVRVKSAAGADWGWWEFGADGALVRWGVTFADGESVEYVYGPIRDFGGVRFPAWGAATDGTWRFDYVQVRLSPDPIAPGLLEVPE